MSPCVYQAVGVVAFALNVWGNLELTKIGNRGHIIRLCSNVCWLVYSPLVGAWALMLNHATFAGINMLGYHRWKKAEREGRIRGVGTLKLEEALDRLSQKQPPDLPPVKFETAELTRGGGIHVVRTQDQLCLETVTGDRPFEAKSSASPDCTCFECLSRRYKLT